MFKVKQFQDGIAFYIWVQPKSSRKELVGVKEDSLKIKVSASPEKGKANKECLNYLAKLFDVAKSQVTILSGKASRKKRIYITDLTPSDVYQILESFLKK